uniref:Uncharacterized protein n=1 Tax=Populus trichocarpa TaxID=3694 RepID=A0A2K2C433_POPTR
MTHFDVANFFKQADEKVDIFYICLANSATTHTIPRYKQYFSNLRMIKAEVNTISGSTNLIESFERTNIMLLEGTRFIIDNVLFKFAKFQGYTS